MSPAALTDADFVKVRDFVYRRTGIQFGPTKRYFVDKRVVALVEESGADGFDGYFSLLRTGDPQAVEGLVNALTVNETYFLREDYQFDALTRSVLPQVLAAARRGVYGERSLARVPHDELRRYFTRLPDGRHQVSADLREAVSFDRVNVCDPAQMARYRGFDVVFCRNLLIYFDVTSSRLATDNLHDALRPGGFVLLGHSESMSRISSVLTPRRFPDALVYQRPEPGARR